MVQAAVRTRRLLSLARRWQLVSCCSSSSSSRSDGGGGGSASSLAADQATAAVVVVHSGLSSASSRPLCYTRGWAWQTVLLQQRLLYKRSHQQQQQQQQTSLALSQPPQPPPNVVLVLEHEPVYTLGRGATVDHLTCLSSHAKTTIDVSPADEDGKMASYSYQECRRRLDRSYRGDDAARLRLTSDCLIHIERLLLQDNDCIVNQFHSTASVMTRHDTSLTTRHIPSGVMAAVESLSTSIQQQQRHYPPVTTTPTRQTSNSCIPIYRMERGGEVTFHGPGQLVLYPIFDLSLPPFSADLHWYLRQLEQAVIDAILELCRVYNRTDIVPHRDDAYTGVWINKSAKIAAIGVAASRWITTHGIALNVTTDLSYFDEHMIVPCGILESKANDDDNANTNASENTTANKRTVTSLAALGIHATVSEVADILVKHLGRVFAVQVMPGAPLC